MKNFFLLFILSFLITACGKGSSSSVDTSFKIQPDSLTKFEKPSASYDIGSGSHTGNFAIINKLTVNGINYVGIACSDSPDPELNNETYNLKIYFTADEIPSGSVDINPTIIENGVAGTANLIQFEISSTTETDSYTYTIYTISGTSSFGDISINAVYTLAN